MGVTYRTAGVEDLPALARLRWEMEVERKQAARDLDSCMHAYVEALRDDVERGAHISWLAEDGSAPVAGITLIWGTWRPISLTPVTARRRRGFVSNVDTRPAYRRQGISRALMTTLIVWARKHDLRRLILWASDRGARSTRAWASRRAAGWS